MLEGGGSAMAPYPPLHRGADVIGFPRTEAASGDVRLCLGLSLNIWEAFLDVTPNMHRKTAEMIAVVEKAHVCRDQPHDAVKDAEYHRAREPASRFPKNGFGQLLKQPRVLRTVDVEQSALLIEVEDE